MVFNKKKLFNNISNYLVYGKEIKENYLMNNIEGNIFDIIKFKYFLKKQENIVIKYLKNYYDVEFKSQGKKERNIDVTSLRVNFRKRNKLVVNYFESAKFALGYNIIAIKDDEYFDDKLIINKKNNLSIPDNFCNKFIPSFRFNISDSLLHTPIVDSNVYKLLAQDANYYYFTKEKPKMIIYDLAFRVDLINAISIKIHYKIDGKIFKVRKEAYASAGPENDFAFSFYKAHAEEFKEFLKNKTEQSYLDQALIGIGYDTTAENDFALKPCSKKFDPINKNLPHIDLQEEGNSRFTSFGGLMPEEQKEYYLGKVKSLATKS